MKHTSTLLAAVLVFASAAFTPPASAQVTPATPTVSTVISSATFTNSATRTTGYTDVDVLNSENVGLICRFTGSGTNAVDTLVLIWARSADGTNFETTPRISWTVPLNATTAVVGYTNLINDAFGPVKTLRLISVQNTGNNTATGAVVEVVHKLPKYRVQQ